jgi:hypothetical protein
MNLGNIVEILDILTPEEEDRLLTQKIGSISDRKCFLMVITSDSFNIHGYFGQRVTYDIICSSGFRFDHLWRNHGQAVADSIREHILENRARRTLQQEEALTTPRVSDSGGGSQR